MTLDGAVESRRGRWRLWVVVGGRWWPPKWPKSGPDAQPRTIEHGLFWATLRLLIVVVWLPMVVEVLGELGGASGGGGWLEKWLETTVEADKKIAQNRGRQRQG